MNSNLVLAQRRGNTVSGIRESNSRLWLGKPAYYHCTNPASRSRRVAIAALVILAATFSVGTRSALGQGERQTVHLDQNAIEQGYTLTATSGGLTVGIPSAALTSETDVVLQRGRIDPTPLPAGRTAVSDFWVFDLRQAQPAKLTSQVELRVAYASESFGRRSLYLGTGKTWVKLRSVDDSKQRVVVARTSQAYGQIVVLEDARQFEGIASWYRSRRQPYGAAVNILPFGTRLRVTNLENGKSVVVTVVSRGPFVKGRVIDLAQTAFAAIAPRGSGLARVRLTSLSTQQTVTPTDAPAVTAPVALVFDTRAGTTIWSKGDSVVRPIASITKLMTALVVLETRPDWDALVTMIEDDVPKPEAGVRIRIAAGGKVSVRDLFYSTLTASANNAALALARSTGLSVDEFVRRMNAKAAELGLTSMHFDEPSGLATTNVANAVDLAKLVSVAMENELIRKATSRRSYSFTERTAGGKHTVRNPVYLYNRLLDDSPIVGAKTGFINEAGHCIVLVARGVGGKLFAVVVLGSPTTTTRSQDARWLIDWARSRF